MTDIRTPRRRRGLGFVRGMAIATVAAAALALGTSGTASAAVDGANNVVDGSGNNIEAFTIDTAINFVPPLDGNPFTREWFHNGRAGFKITGPGQDDFGGTITMGYQVGYPATFDGNLTFSYSTPQLLITNGLGLGFEIPLDGTLADPTIGLATGTELSDILPQLSVELSVGPGPGIVDVPTAEGEISGAGGEIALANFQGTVTGVVGQTSVRPYVKVKSGKGDTVVAYGPIFRN